MKNLKIGTILLLALAASYLLGLYTFHWFSNEMNSDLDIKIKKLKSLDAEIEANLHFYENVRALEYISMLKHLEQGRSKEIEEILKSYLKRSYWLALNWPESGTEEEHYKEANLKLINEIEELSKESELFNEILESGKTDS